MANLLPSQAKKAVLREYWIRVVTVWLFLLTTAVVLIAIMSGPVYVLITNQLRVGAGEYASAALEADAFETIENEIIHANTMANVLVTQKSKTSLLALVATLKETAGSAVVVAGYELAQDKGQVTQVAIRGVAEDRASLVAFSQRLEDLPMVASADVPLSSLAKERDIPFSLRVELNPNTP